MNTIKFRLSNPFHVITLLNYALQSHFCAYYANLYETFSGWKIEENAAHISWQQFADSYPV